MAKGSKILRRMEEIAARGVPLSRVGDQKGDTYLLEGEEFRARITVDPDAWLGISLEILDPLGGRLHSYDIDTDNYKISDPGHESFAAEVEDEIVRLLDALVQGRILIGHDRKGRPSVILPGLEGFGLIQKKSLLGVSYESMKHRLSDEELAALVRLDDFRPLRVG